MDKPETKCKTCVGCSKQELENFKGIYRCEYYINYNELKKKLGERENGNSNRVRNY